jgi:hypothetical protein
MAVFLGGILGRCERWRDSLIVGLSLTLAESVKGKVTPDSENKAKLIATH